MSLAKINHVILFWSMTSKSKIKYTYNVYKNNNNNKLKCLNTIQ